METIRPKRRVWLVAVLAVFVMVISIPVQPVATQVVDEPWPMFRHDPANTGAVEVPAPSLIWPKWEFDTMGPVASSPSIAYGNVYFGSYDRNIYCLDAETGSLKWKYPTEYKVRSGPAVKDGKVYTGADDGNIYCIDALKGTLIWKTPTEGGLVITTLQSTAQIRSSPTVVGDRVYVGALDSKLYCLNKETGTIVWAYPTRDRIVSSPAVVYDKVYVGSCDGHLYCLREDDGKFLWRYDTIQPPPEGFITTGEAGLTEVAASPMIHEDAVYVFGNSGWWFALNATDGTLIWKKFLLKYSGKASTSQAIPCGSLAYANGKVYLMNVYLAAAVNAKTGETIWETSVGYTSYTSSSYADGKIYAPSDLPGLYCLDAEDGTGLSKFTPGSNIWSSPSIAYGNVYIGSMDWHLYCLSQRPPKTKTSITGNLSAVEVEFNTSITVKGAITPAPTPAPQVTVTFKLPDETAKNVSTTASEDGTYEISYTPDVEGTWTAKASWAGSDLYEGASISEVTFTVTVTVPPPPPPPPRYDLVAIAVVLAIVIISAVYLRSKR